MTLDLAVVVVTAGHIPARQELCARLLRSLEPHPEGVRLDIVADKAPHWEWSEKAWGLLADSGKTWGMLLQDDVIPCPDFWAVLSKVLDAKDTHVIALNNCQLGPSVAQAQERIWHWVTSNDGLIGHGYVMPTIGWQDLMEWRRLSLKPGAVERINEDTLVDLWAMHREFPIWHPVPALIEHDDTTASTWGNPHSPGSLRALAPPKPGMVDMDWTTDAVHAGRVKTGNHRMLIHELVGDDYRARVERYYALEGQRA